MRLSKPELLHLATATGHRPEILEKVQRLLELLDAVFADSYMANRLVLKGGTALNLFVLNIPRLSVDADINYIGSTDKATMEAERPEIVERFRIIAQRVGLTPKGAPDEHAGGKWRMTYDGAIMPTGNVEVDLNFLQRIPLWAPKVMDSHKVGDVQARNVVVLDVHDLAGGKLTALFSRTAARDLFDTAQLAAYEGIDIQRLRLAHVIYGSASRRDWRTIQVEDTKVDLEDIEDRLLPLLRESEMPAPAERKAWAAELLDRAKSLTQQLLPFNAAESAFLDQLHDQGEIVTTHLGLDPSLAERVQLNPALAWKALNVKEYYAKGLTSPSAAKERRRRK